MKPLWILDLVLLILLLGSAWLLFRLEFGRLLGDARGVDGPDDAGLQAEDRGGLRLYPARLIRQAGRRPDAVGGLYWSSKLVLGLLLGLGMAELGRYAWPWWTWLGAGLAGSFLPELWLLGRRRRRRAEIESALSFFINLMVVYLQSGMNLTQAFRQAAEHGLKEEHPLAQEVGLLALEIDAGRDRDAAFAMLAERTGVPSLMRLAAIIGVAYRAGSPVVETLRAQAELLKARQDQQAAELVNRKSMEAMLPMLLISFPMFVMLVLFPAVQQVFEVLGMIGELF